MPRVFKRGKVWHAWIPLHGGGVERKSTNCTDRKAAEARAIELERIAADPDGAAQEAATLRDAFGLLIRDREGRVKAGKGSEETVKFYRKKAHSLLTVVAEVLRRRADAPVYLRECTAALVDDVIAQRRDDGVKENTIAKELTTWRTTMRLAKRRSLWKGDLDAVFPVGFSPNYEPRGRWVSPEELVKLYHAMVRPTLYRGGSEGPERGHELFAIVAFSIATSAESAAIWRAKREDIAEDLSSVRVRGTKNSRRDRVVPLMLLEFRLLLRYAVSHADGEHALFMDREGSFRHRLHEACERAGIEPLCPTDLRRTHAKWLRLRGVVPSAIAPSMGHVDSRMVERVYGRATAMELAHLQAAQIAASTVLYVCCDEVKRSPIPMLHAKPKTTETPIFPVPRDRIELPTRGFSIDPEGPEASAKVANSDPDCAVCVQEFRARARRWLTREAA